MKRRYFLAAVSGGLSATGGRLAAQQRIPSARLGVFSQGRLDGWPLTGLTKGLSELGHSESTLLIHQTQVSDYSNLEPRARELLEKRPNVIVAYGATPARAVIALTTSTPVVVVSGSDPVEAGLSRNFARPSENVTGFVGATPDMQGKRIELIKEALPSARRIGVLFDPSTSNERRLVDQASEAAGRAGLDLQQIEVRSGGDLAAALSKLRGMGAEALLTLPSTTLSVNANTLGAMATRQQLPGLFHSREFAMGGGLASFGANTYETFRQVAGYVDRILSGTRLSELPFQRPEHVELVVNLRAARELGVHFSHAFLARASETIE
jgi:putative tryptophan/tyrosine transport system substrate-binding protein